MTIPQPKDPKSACKARRLGIATDPDSGRFSILFGCDRAGKEGCICPVGKSLPLFVDVVLENVPKKPRLFYRIVRGRQKEALNAIQESCAKARAELQ